MTDTLDVTPAAAPSADAAAAPASGPALFDPSVFEHVTKDVAEMTVLHPQTNAQTSWVIQFAGPTHPMMIAKADADAQEMLQTARRMRSERVNGKKVKVDGKTPDQARREAVEDIVAQIVGWRGATVAFDREAATTMLLNPAYTFLLRQINDFLEDEAGFIETSAKT
jgi:hypothetical protein